MVLLGLVTMGSSSASIFKDGKCIAAVEEERLTRIKNDGAFPIESIKECLKIANLKLQDVDAINIYWKPWKIKKRSIGVIKKVFTSKLAALNILQKLFQHIFLKKDDDYPENNGKWIDLFFTKKILKKNFGQFNAKILFFDHHLTHQIYAETIRKWNNSIILSYDGGGEEYSTVLSLRKEDKLINIKKFSWPNSLGHFYSFFTGYLGFKMQEGEYKMMGLAPYGEPVYKDVLLKKIIFLRKNGEYKINLKLCDYHSALRNKFNKELHDFLPRNLKKNEKPSQDHINLASSVQHVFELTQIHILKHIKNIYPTHKKLVITGGCGLNVTANGKVLQTKMFDEVIVPPAPHDAGCAVGSNLAFYSTKKIIKNINISSPYLGSSYTNDEIKKAFLDLNLIVPKKLKTENDVVDNAAKVLSEGNVIAWFQGKHEFGPRALGSRSFLADPRKDSIREVINKKIKKRELFRPFAPSTILEKSNDYFDLNQESPYMNMVANVKENMKKIIPAVTHIDGTARVHTVTEKSNQIYYKLIKKFGAYTNVFVLLNTSFNIQEPIVYSPKDAIKTFLKSDVDYMFIGNYMCDINWRKKNN